MKIGKEEVAISHLQYTYDVILFGAWESDKIKNMVKVLECFHAVSGAKNQLEQK